MIRYARKSVVHNNGVSSPIHDAVVGRSFVLREQYDLHGMISNDRNSKPLEQGVENRDRKPMDHDRKEHEPVYNCWTAGQHRSADCYVCLTRYHRCCQVINLGVTLTGVGKNPSSILNV